MIPKSVIIFLYLLDIIQYLFFFLLHRIGLNPSFRAEPSPWDHQELLLFSAGIAPSTSTADSLLKSRLPVVEYRSLVKGTGNSAAAECAICLQFVEARDHVRELQNCCHAFHVGCMDKWLDLGRLSCPLCRSTVVPDGHGRRGPLSVLKVLMVDN